MNDTGQTGHELDWFTPSDRCRYCGSAIHRGKEVHPLCEELERTHMDGQRLVSDRVGFTCDELPVLRHNNTEPTR